MCLKNRKCEKFVTSLLVVSHMGMKMTGSFAANTVSRSHSLKTGEEESKLL